MDDETTAATASDTSAPAPLSEGDAPARAPESSTEAPGEAPPRARGQRGPDKRPRARRGSPDTGPKAPDPFAGPVTGEAKEAPRKGHVGDPKKRAGKGAGAAGAVNVAEMLGMSPSELAALAVGVGNALIVQTAAMRYGAVRARDLSLTPDESPIVVGLTEKYLNTVMLSMTPGEALAWTCVLLYGSKIAALEFGPKPREHDGGPPPAVVIDVDAKAA